jgi:hypothetical protein
VGLLRRIAFVLLALAPAEAALAQERNALEHEVKAAFLFKFPAFVEWPQAPAGRRPFVIAVLGAEDVAAGLRGLARGRSLNGRRIEVRDSPAEADMVFVGRSETARLAQLATRLQGAPVLIVSESSGALDQGSMINFVPESGRVRFEVALDAAERSGLRISSRLLALAQSVRRSRL